MVGMGFVRIELRTQDLTSEYTHLYPYRKFWRLGLRQSLPTIDCKVEELKKHLIAIIKNMKLDIVQKLTSTS